MINASTNVDPSVLEILQDIKTAVERIDTTVNILSGKHDQVSTSIGYFHTRREDVGFVSTGGARMLSSITEADGPWATTTECPSSLQTRACNAKPSKPIPDLDDTPWSGDAEGGDPAGWLEGPSFQAKKYDSEIHDMTAHPSATSSVVTTGGFDVGCAHPPLMALPETGANNAMAHTSSVESQDRKGTTYARSRYSANSSSSRQSWNTIATGININGKSIYRIARYIVEHPLFDGSVGCIILLNCVVIGVNTQMMLDDENSNFVRKMSVVDLIFVLIYTIELLLRLAHAGWRIFESRWVLFDALLIAVSTIDWMLTTTGQKYLMLRVLRLLRLLRAVRMIQQFKTLLKLAIGILHSANAMFSTLVLIFLVLFVFACLGTDVITKDQRLREDSVLDDMIETQFGSILRFILTLVQFVTLDGVADIYFPLILAKPILVLYFVPLILFVSIALMNLITALIVEGALETAAADRETLKAEMSKKVRSLTPLIKEVYGQLDADKSGVITRSEIETFDVNLLPQEFQDLVDPESMVELFEMLDLDHSGQITEDEFVDGVLHLSLTEVPIELIQILKLVRMQYIKQSKKDDLAAKQKRYKRKLKKVFVQLDVDHDGVISPREIETLDIGLLPIDLRDHVDQKSMTEFFQILDVDSSGEISEDEFVSGILQLSMGHVPLEMMLILKHIQLLKAQFNAPFQVFQDVSPVGMKCTDKILGI